MSAGSMTMVEPCDGRRPGRRRVACEPLLADDPWWLALIKALLIFVILLLLTLFAIWFERKVVGRMQHRPGPNWNGPVRPAAVAGRRAEAALQGGHHPGQGGQGRLHPGPGDRAPSRRS